MKVTPVLKTTALITVLIVLFAGCTNRASFDGVIPVTPDAEARLSTEAHKSIEEGTTKKALQKFKHLYNKPSYRNNEVILNYAQLLRNDDEPQAAMDVIYGFAFDRNDNIKSHVSAAVVNELAAIKTEIGDFKTAQNLASQVLNNSYAKDFYADAHNLMGVALDADGKHRTAEIHLRKALELWKGDSTSVKNNLAVCLASQGRFDEALMHLRQALIEAPNKEEIAKNIELINLIRESVIPKAPTK